MIIYIMNALREHANPGIQRENPFPGSMEMKLRQTMMDTPNYSTPGIGQVSIISLTNHNRNRKAFEVISAWISRRQRVAGSSLGAVPSVAAGSGV